MYIKIGNTIVNLDLVKGICEIEACLGQYGFNRTSTSYTNVLNKEKEEKWLNLSVNGDEDQRNYHVYYQFEVEYLEGDSKIVKVQSKEKAVKVREELGKLLNNNQPIIHIINID